MLELATTRRGLDLLLGGPGYEARLPEGRKIAGAVVLTGTPLENQNVRTCDDDIAAAQGWVVEIPIAISRRIELDDWRHRLGCHDFPLMLTTRRPHSHVKRLRRSRINLRRWPPEHSAGQFIEESGRVSWCHKNKGAQANGEQPANSSAVHGANPREPSCWLTPLTAGGSTAVSSDCRPERERALSMLDRRGEASDCRRPTASAPARPCRRAVVPIVDLHDQIARHRGPAAA